MVYSVVAINRVPYQNTSATAKKTIACVKAKRKLERIAVFLDSRNGFKRHSEYDAQQSSSRVRDATVRMEPAASHARCAEASYAILLDWSLSTTTFCGEILTQ